MMIKTPGLTTSAHHTAHVLATEAMGLDLDLDCDCAFFSRKQPPFATLVAPVLYALELTPLCPHRCAGCSNVFAHTTEHAPLGLAGWLQVLDTIAPYAQRIKLTGGEPTCHPQFAEIIAALHQRAIPFTLFSNGNWQQPESIIELLRHVPNCLGILVSLHGADATTHEHFTGVAGSFANVVETIQRVTQAGIVVHTNTVISRYNAQRLEAVAAFSQQLGAACSVYNSYIGASLPGLDLTTDELRQVADELNRLATAGYSIKIGTPLLPNHNDTPYPCSAGTAYGTIDPWGYVRPCNHAPLIAGNILHDRLEVLWQNEAMHMWRVLATESVWGAGNTANTCAIGNTACRADMLLRKA